MGRYTVYWQHGHWASDIGSWAYRQVLLALVGDDIKAQRYLNLNTSQVDANLRYSNYEKNRLYPYRPRRKSANAPLVTI